MEAFFQKLRDKNVFKTVKNIGNTLAKIYKVEEKEAAAEKKERQKANRLRSLKNRRKKRKAADGKAKGPVVKQKEEKKDFNWMTVALLGALGIGTIALFKDKIIAKIKEEVDKKVEEEKQKLIDKINEKKEEFLDSINPFKDKKDLDSEEKKEADKLIEGLQKEQKQAEKDIKAAGLDLPDAETPPAVEPSPNQEAPTVQPAQTPPPPRAAAP